MFSKLIKSLHKVTSKEDLPDSFLMTKNVVHVVRKLSWRLPVGLNIKRNFVIEILLFTGCKISSIYSYCKGFIEKRTWDISDVYLKWYFGTKHISESINIFTFFNYYFNQISISHTEVQIVFVLEAKINISYNIS